MKRAVTAADGFGNLGLAHEEVRICERQVSEIRADLARVEQKLQRARDAFDKARTEAIELCPALETGYGAAGLTETVAIVEGKVVVVPTPPATRGRTRADEVSGG